MNNDYIHMSDLHLGAQYINETLNDEFKKFTINRDDILKNPNRNEFENFYLSGKLNQTVEEYIKNKISDYINFYVPKYTVCFFNLNIKNTISHSDSFLFIGIDDNGTISGIPINPELDLQVFNEFINFEIKKTIILNLYDNVISHDLILSCIEPHIYILNKSYTKHAKLLMQNNRKKIQDLNKEKYRLFEMIYLKRKYVDKMLKSAAQITVENFRQNYQIISRFLKELISNNDIEKSKTNNDNDNEILAIFDKNNQEHINYLLYLIAFFDPKKNFDTNYKKELTPKPSIEDIKKNTQKQNALGTLFHLELKKKSEKNKKTLINKYNKEKVILKWQEDKFNRILIERSNLYYSIETHLDKMTFRNNFILIKIKFNQEKYQQLIKGLNHKPLKFKNDNGDFVTTTRKMKYIGNKLDPECFILSKNK